ncbi:MULTISPECIES: DUF2125 domain-containing protein [Paracoccus]|uniref:DUF2125 domain-containing protein n=1 Tax=Paracoccus TaxID=265 RepID=UPI00086C7BB7|nr:MULTISPECIES: DUF2125 domain-containing protein [Paracoccus]ODT61479.1 MAG: hypothetical protein ABS73_00835 [Paracoccus sp. SCN 68-21]
MRGAVIGTGLVAAIVVGGWLGVETLARDRVAAWVATDPALEAASVTALRDPRQIGVALTDLRFSDPAFGVALPWMRAWLSPLAPLTAQLDLPDQAQVMQGGQVMQLGLSAPVASLSLAPLNRMAPDRLDLQAQDVTLDGQPLADALSVQARMVPLGADAPRPARAAYGVDLSLEGLDVGGLARLGLDPGPLPGPVGAQGPVRIWLDGTPSVTGDQVPQIVGWQTEGLALQAGQIGLRIIGRLSRDAQGRAEGQVALYSADADAMIGMAVGLGLIPPQGQLLLRAGLSQLSRADLDDTLPGPDFPGPAEGELRLPIIMRNGQLILGGVPIGPAPAI